MTHRNSVCVVLVAAMLSFGQANTWTNLDTSLTTGAGTRTWASLVYCADSNRFISSMGWLNNGSWDPPTRYSELMLTLPDGRWINFLPHDTLYGKWADSTGNTLGSGNNFETPAFKMVEGYLRPGVYYSTHKTFYQSAYDSDNGCIYYYLANRTIRYNTHTRLWDTLVTATQPTAYAGGTSPLIWGALCYDPVNQEVVLFGGGDVDAPNGHCGTWVYKPADNTWTKLTLATEPPPRCLSQMVYDAKNQCIVLFGGDHLDYTMADTWVYDCATRTWSEKAPALSPSPRAGHALLYLPKSQYVVLMGGYTNKPYNVADGPSYYSGYMTVAPFEMWRYDPAANEWKLIKSFGTGDLRPAWSFQAMAAADTNDRIVCLSDSNMYRGWIKHTFTLDCDPAQIDEAGTVSAGVAPGTEGRRDGAGDPAWFTTGVDAPNPDSLVDVYKQMPVNTWIRMTPPRNPYRGRDWGTRVLDPDHDLLLVWSGGHSAYCGSDVPQYSPFTNRWQLGYTPELMIELNGDGGNSGNYCNYFTFNNRPFMTGHSYRNYCYSTVLKRLVKHHPSKYTFFYDPVTMDWDTAKALNPPNDAGGIYRTCLTGTPHGVFGWIQMRQGCCNTYFDFFLMDASKTWSKLAIRGDTAVPNYYCEDGNAIYDGKRDRMLIVSSTERGQVWAYTFADSTLSKLNPTGSYSASSLWREGAYLPAQDKVLIMGNGSHAVYNCASNQWETLTVTKGSGVGTTSSVSSGYAYDPARDLVWDVEQNCEVYCLRVAGGYDPDTLPMKTGRVLETPAVDLFSAAPNPFNPQVAVTVASASRAPVSVRVYDLRGRLVAVLLDNAALSGPVTLTWRAETMGSGMYLIRKYAGAKCAATLKIVKIK